jgi:hypothetical protein
MPKPDPKPLRSFRQVKIARERAKAALTRFVGAAEMASNPLTPPAEAGINDFTKEGLRILSEIARDNDPPESALASLTKALNRPVIEFYFFSTMSRQLGTPQYRISPEKPEHRIAKSRMLIGSNIVISRVPYEIIIDRVRDAAEALREYLELIPICGLIHSACQFPGCTKIVFGGRGNKKYCSDEHRKAFWTYDRQREYFQQKQRETYSVRKRMKKGARKDGRQR